MNLSQICELFPPSGVVYGLMLSRPVPGAAVELTSDCIYNQTS